MSNKQENKMQDLVREFITEVGEDAARAGLIETPARVARAYKNILDGYSRSLEDEITNFENSYGYDDLIYSGKIDFFSLCEHHLLPFYGEAHVAYIPNKKIVGLSKMARAVDIYSHRLQEQERLTAQIAESLDTLLDAKGVIVMLRGKHFCNMARGVQKVNSNMKTIVSRGEFKKNEKLYDRFFSLIGTE